MRLTKKYLPVRVIGNSMLPTLTPGDFLVIKIGGNIQIGDLVAFKQGEVVGQLLIKRVVDLRDAAYWVSGDNVKESDDSRKFGWVESNQIIGKVIFKYWPRFKKSFKVNL
jgi:phage repressor protein C with HTH and peptisase S24 domain